MMNSFQSFLNNRVTIDQRALLDQTFQSAIKKFDKNKKNRPSSNYSSQNISLFSNNNLNKSRISSNQYSTKSLSSLSDQNFDLNTNPSALMKSDYKITPFSTSSKLYFSSNKKVPSDSESDNEIKDSQIFGFYFEPNEKELSYSSRSCNKNIKNNNEKKIQFNDYNLSNEKNERNYSPRLNSHLTDSEEEINFSPQTLYSAQPLDSSDSYQSLLKDDDPIMIRVKSLPSSCQELINTNKEEEIKQFREHLKKRVLSKKENGSREQNTTLDSDRRFNELKINKDISKSSNYQSTSINQKQDTYDKIPHKASFTISNNAQIESNYQKTSKSSEICSSRSISLYENQAKYDVDENNEIPQFSQEEFNEDINLVNKNFDTLIKNNANENFSVDRYKSKSINAASINKTNTNYSLSDDTEMNNLKSRSNINLDNKIIDNDNYSFNQTNSINLYDTDINNIKTQIKNSINLNSDTEDTVNYKSRQNSISNGIIPQKINNISNSRIYLDDQNSTQSKEDLNLNRNLNRKSLNEDYKDHLSIADSLNKHDFNYYNDIDKSESSQILTSNSTQNKRMTIEDPTFSLDQKVLNSKINSSLSLVEIKSQNKALFKKDKDFLTQMEEDINKEKETVNTKLSDSRSTDLINAFKQRMMDFTSKTVGAQQRPIENKEKQVINEFNLNDSKGFSNEQKSDSFLYENDELNLLDDESFNLQLKNHSDFCDSLNENEFNISSNILSDENCDFDTYIAQLKESANVDNEDFARIEAELKKELDINESENDANDIFND